MLVTNDIEILVQLFSIKKRIDLKLCRKKVSL